MLQKIIQITRNLICGVSNMSSLSRMKVQQTCLQYDIKTYTIAMKQSYLLYYWYLFKLLA